MRRTLLTLLLASLALAGCGGEDSSSGGGGTPRGAGMVPPLAEVELTDALMEEYVKLLGELRQRTKRGETGLQWLGAYGWNAERWAYIQQGVTQAFAMKAMGSLSATASRYDEMVADLESRVAGATGTQKQILETQLEGLRKSRESMQVARQQTSAWDTPVGRKNLEVLERWMPRIEDATK